MSIDTSHDPLANFERELDRQAQLERESEALWGMSSQERVCAMWAGQLTLQQLSEWSARRPHEVPRIDGEFAWIAVTTPECAEVADRRAAVNGSRPL